MTKQKRLHEQGVTKEMAKELIKLSKNRKNSVVMINVKKAKNKNK